MRSQGLSITMITMITTVITAGVICGAHEGSAAEPAPEDPKITAVIPATASYDAAAGIKLILRGSGFVTGAKRTEVTFGPQGASGSCAVTGVEERELQCKLSGALVLGQPQQLIVRVSHDGRKWRTSAASMATFTPLGKPAVMHHQASGQAGAPYVQIHLSGDNFTAGDGESPMVTFKAGDGALHPCREVSVFGASNLVCYLPRQVYSTNPQTNAFTVTRKGEAG